MEQKYDPGTIKKINKFNTIKKKKAQPKSLLKRKTNWGKHLKFISQKKV